jgi:anti-anti-sigma regulatory factor
MDPDLKITMAFDGDVIRISVVGRIVRIGNAHELRDKVQAACDMQVGQVIEIDLTRVLLMDATGVNTLVAGLAIVEGAGLGFRVRPSPFIATELRVCRLYHLLVSPCAGGRP